MTSILLLNLLVTLGCSHQFGDASTGGADGSSTIVTSIASVGSAPTATVTATTTTVAASSSTGNDPMGRCLTDTGSVFSDDFSSANPAWTAVTAGNTADFAGDVSNGTLNLRLGTVSALQMVSPSVVQFQDCYVEVEQVETSTRVDEVRLDDQQGTYLSFYGTPSGGTANVYQQGAAVVTQPLGRRRFVRLRSENSDVFVATSEDGVLYEPTIRFARPSFATPSLRLVFAIFPSGSGDDTAKWDNVNTP